MRIEDTHVQQASRHHADGHGKKDADGVRGRHHHHHHHDDEKVRGHKRPESVTISDEARSRYEKSHGKPEEARGSEIDIPAGLGRKGFLGKLVRAALKGADISIGDVMKAVNSRPAKEAAPADGASPQSGFSASVAELGFSASGTIKTADGKEVGFTLELNLTKASLSAFSASSDPMTVNYAGTSSELTSMSFKFSLDSGEEEGSGLLTVDKEDADSGGADVKQAEAPAFSSANEFLKALRRADFTSTYLSFSRTTIEASSSFSAVAEGAPASLPTTTGSNTPALDLVA